jgi:hypothetical protein
MGLQGEGVWYDDADSIDETGFCDEFGGFFVGGSICTVVACFGGSDGGESQKVGGVFSSKRYSTSVLAARRDGEQFSFSNGFDLGTCGVDQR